MNAARLLAVLRIELGSLVRRPVLWVLVALLLLSSYGLADGGLTISSGDTQVGGTKAWVNSEFAIANALTFLVFLFYTFFIAVAAGMSVIRDDELQVGEVLHGTPLRPAEYIWGKFGANLLVFLLVLGVHMVSILFFFQFFPIANADEIRGPFVLGAYLRPALYFALPMILFFAGTSFSIGERSRRPIIVFALPVAALLLCAFFLWSWSPSWLDPRINKLLMVLDPSGFRWLSETWLKVDRGVHFYNTQPIGLDLLFLANRLGFMGIALGAVALAQRHFAASLQGAKEAPRRWWRRRASRTGSVDGLDPAPVVSRTTTPLADLGMTFSPPTLLRGIVDVARIELRELRSQPGLYLFVPLILLQVLGTSLSAVGSFGTPVLLTAGNIGLGSINTLTLLVCLLLLFYTVESLERERSTGLAAMYYATPVRSASILFGKAVANSLVGLAILVAAFVGAAIALLVQGRTPLEISPFFWLWGVLLVPTFLVWSSFVTAVFSLVRERYTTYGIALAAIISTGYFQFRGFMNWVFNWNLWNAIRWSDMGTLELDRLALVLNRSLMLALAILFTAVAVKSFGRRDRDASQVVHRLHPLSILWGTLRLLPYAAAPLLIASVLGFQVRNGSGGGFAEKADKDYWRKNLATFVDAPLPTIDHIDLDVELEPERSWFRVEGTYRLRNHLDHAIRLIPLTGSRDWEELEWSLNGEEYEPDDRAKLFVFEPSPPLEPGETIEIGFRHHGVFPGGVSKNGGGRSQFILPSGVVLHAFTPSFIPVLGYLHGIGVDKDNSYDSRLFPDDHYKEVLQPAFASATPFTSRVRVTVPEEYLVNSVGSLTEEEVSGGRRTVVWETDHPVKLLNLVAGKWDVERAGGTAIFHHPGHHYNVAEMSEALQGARRFYSEWFYPFPWKELKLSEFPNLAGYAQGFPTNITFSEGIGFLTKSDPRSNAAFLVTAHESAHQWWGNILTPGLGPGGNVLSEGMAHFSTILLTGELKGERDRIEVCKRFEESYGDNRRVDSERPLVKIDGSRGGDTTVTYDKGGWVAWMLYNLMGPDANLQGLQEFVRAFKDGPDHPLLEDMIASLRVHAPDPAAFDAFVEQWFFDVVIPEYRFEDVSLDATGDDARGQATPRGWRVRLRLRNAGTGRMPIEVAALAGDRFDEDGKPEANYREARVTIVLGAGEEQVVEISTSFEPDRVIVDPDARVLQLQREAAIVRF